MKPRFHSRSGLAFTALALCHSQFASGNESLNQLCAKYDVSDAVTLAADGSYQIDPSELDYRVLANYRQKRASTSDLLSDYALAATSMTVPKKIWWVMRKKPHKIEISNREVHEAYPCAREIFSIQPREYFELIDEPKSWIPSEKELAVIDALPVSETARHLLLEKYFSGKIGLEGDLNPIRVKEAARMFEQVIYEEWRDNGLEAKFGREHKWSREFSRHAQQFSPISDFSKLLVAMSRGVTDIYMTTEKEADLRRFILEQPFRASGNGMTLDQLFRASYRLSEGNVYLALLTIQNVLAIQWRDQNRESLSSTLRFSPIVNYFGKGADHYGSWYHLFGITLYGYTRSLLSAKWVAYVESAGSHVLFSFEKETQEDHINAKGAKLGTLLRKIVKKKTYMNSSDDPGVLVPQYYLNLNEDFTARLTQLARKLERKR